MEEIQHIAIDMDVAAEIPKKKNAENNSRRSRRSDLMNLIKKRLQEVPENPFEDMSIFRVPARFQEAHKGLFEPRMVSIGPYHRGKESLCFMEEQKWHFLRDFLEGGQNVGIKVYIREIEALEDRARRCYSENFEMKSDDFVMMLLLDGCFLLEHFLKSSSRKYSAYCNLGWVVGNLSTDLVLLDNQIPFFIIHKLFAIQRGMTCSCESFECPLLKDLIFNTPLCSGQIITSATGEPPKEWCDSIYHYLHLVYICMTHNDERERDYLIKQKSHHRGSHFPKSRDAAPQTYAAELDMVTYAEELNMLSASKSGLKMTIRNQVIIPCASKLHAAGVTFKRKKNPRDRFDISFTNGTMEIPLLSLSYYRKILWVNIAAFEQTQKFYTDKRKFVSYLALMDALVNTEEDVALLEQTGILMNMLPSEKDAADFFNDLGDLFVAEKYTGHYLFKEIRKYSDSTWHKQRARLMHNYFGNPWSAISVLAAGSLLILSILQTYYSSKGH
ncbi:hypothetical protein LUZ62_015343 [Rhynchospora pubera]|uniref:Uncharacterized protein n=1 Tax=Rhynchospora pubera TaxID=906938 RepID=A0AAV8GBE0_9POAL|nr:hypothetical protein LUZ62_015343 [Rhynchospora pubera]